MSTLSACILDVSTIKLLQSNMLAGLTHLCLDPGMRACGALPDAVPQVS